MIAIAIVALLLGRLRHFAPDEAVRIARAAVADRDPSFPRDAIVVTVDAMEVNVGDPRMSRWDVVLKRRDDSTGYLVEVDGRSWRPARVGRAWDISPQHCSWELPR